MSEFILISNPRVCNIYLCGGHYMPCSYDRIAAIFLLIQIFEEPKCRIQNVPVPRFTNIVFITPRKRLKILIFQYCHTKCARSNCLNIRRKLCMLIICKRSREKAIPLKTTSKSFSEHDVCPDFMKLFGQIHISIFFYHPTRKEK